MTPLELDTLQREKLLQWYDELLVHRDILFIDHESPQITGSQIEELKKNLREQKYMLFVAGQMNSGKSTLLNALIFGRAILPMKSTTMTANITKVVFREKEGLEVVFYSQKEFENIKKALMPKEQDFETDASDDKSPDLAYQQFQQGVAYARQSGVVESEVLGRTNIVRHIDGLDTLTAYVALPDARKGGVYTPYVKEVTIFSNSPWLKSVTVTDTPGISDPNIEREKLTTEYIKQADAIVYVTNAPAGAFNAADEAFLERHILHITGHERIIAANQIDRLPEEDVEEMLRHLTDNTIGIANSLVSDRSQIIPVSALGALGESYYARNEEVPGDLVYDIEDIEELGFLAPEKHQVDVLKEKIERTIIDKAGERLTSGHRQKVETTFVQAQEALKFRTSDLRSSLEESLKSTKEQQDKITQLSRALNELTEEIDDQIKGTEDQFIKQKEDAEERLESSRDEQVRTLTTFIKTDGRLLAPDMIPRRLAQLMTTQLQNTSRALYEYYHLIIKGQIHAELDNLQHNIDVMLKREGLPNIDIRKVILTSQVEASQKQFFQRFQQQRHELVQKLDVLRKEHRRWWEHIPLVRTNRDRMAIGLEGDLREALEKYTHDILEALYRELQTDIKREIGKLEQRVERSLKNQKRMLEDMQDATQDQADLREEWKQELLFLNEQDEKVSTLAERFENEFSSIA